MRTLILWAKAQPTPAYWTVVLLHAILGGTAFLLGVLFGPIDRPLFYGLVMAVGTIMIGTYIAHIHWRQKARGPVPDQIFTGFRMRILLINLCVSSLFVLNGMELISPPLVPPSENVSLHQPIAARSADNDPARQFQRIEHYLQTVRNQVRERFRSPFADMSDTLRLILSVLFLLVATAALVTLVALSCSLACSEMAALAGVALIGGLLLMLIGFPLLFVRLWGLRRQQKPGWGKLLLLSILGLPLLFIIAIITFGNLGVFLPSLIVIALATGLSFIAKIIRKKQS
ncbi:MAG: hypothetical protein AAGM67_14175 [Bacteroidota bacterium]